MTSLELTAILIGAVRIIQRAFWTFNT